MIPSRFRQAHIQTGRSAVRLPDTKDLCDNPPLWRELWLQHGAELLPAWIDENPGSRPDAWWEFDAPPGLERPDDDEVSALHAAGLLDPAELSAIAEKAKTLVEFNRRYQSRDSNFVPPDDLHRFAARIGLIGRSDAAVLRL